MAFDTPANNSADPSGRFRTSAAAACRGVVMRARDLVGLASRPAASAVAATPPVGSGRTEIERALSLTRTSLAMIFSLSFFVNLLALTVPLYLLHIYDHVLASRSIETLVMLTLIVIVALAVHAILETLRRTMLARIGVWLDDRLQAPVLVAAVQSALRGDPAAAAQAWRDIGGLRSFFGGTACTALFDLPWTPIFILAMILVHPLLGAIGLLASVVLFGLAMLNEMVTRKPIRPLERGVGSEPAPLRSRFCAMSKRSAPWACCLAWRASCTTTSPMRRQAQLAAAMRGSAIQALARFVRLLAQVVVMACAAWLVILHDVSPAAIFATSILLGRSLGPVEGAIGTWKAVSGVRLGYGRLKQDHGGGAAAPESHGAAAPDGQTLHRAGHLYAAGRGHAGAAPADLRRQPGRNPWNNRSLGRREVDAWPPYRRHHRPRHPGMCGSTAPTSASGWPRAVTAISAIFRRTSSFLAAASGENIARLQEATPDDVIAAATMVGSA